MPLTRRALSAGVLSLALLLTTACSADGTPTPVDPTSEAAPDSPDSSSAPASTPPADGAADESLPSGASFPADTSADGGPAVSGGTTDPVGGMRVTGLRMATHEGYERLVIDLSTSGLPEWTAQYTEASGPGGGPVDVSGDAFLRVALTTHAEPGDESSMDASSSGLIAQVRTTGLFEGVEEVLVGIRGGELPFRAFALTDPGRIVIDVRR